MEQAMVRPGRRSGWSDAENKMLWETADEAQQQGLPLKAVFERIAEQTGRRPNSIRNYYYAQVRRQGGESHPARFVPFTQPEIDWLMEQVLVARAAGQSVRACLQKLSGGDHSLMLRYQNKYRNMLKKQPERIEETAKNMGLENVVVQKNGQGRGKDFLERRLEKEINELYDRLALSLKNENERLKETLRQLNEENELLRRAARAQSENKHA